MSETPENSPKENTHAILLAHSSMSRLAAQSATCKLWSLVLGVLILILVAGRPGGQTLLWGLLPLILLAFADGGYVGKATQLSSAVGKESGSLDVLRAQGTCGGMPGAFKALSGVVSSSVWPFYLCLAGMIAGLGLTVLNAPSNLLPVPAQSGPLAGGTANGPIKSNLFGGPAGGNPFPGTQGYVGRPPGQGGYPFVGRNGTAPPSAVNRPTFPPGTVPPGSAAPRPIPGSPAGPGTKPSSATQGNPNRPQTVTTQPMPLGPQTPSLPPGNAQPSNATPPSAPGANAQPNPPPTSSRQ